MIAHLAIRSILSKLFFVAKNDFELIGLFDNMFFGKFEPSSIVRLGKRQHFFDALIVEVERIDFARREKTSELWQ